MGAARLPRETQLFAVVTLLVSMSRVGFELVINVSAMLLSLEAINLCRKVRKLEMAARERGHFEFWKQIRTMKYSTNIAR